ncbi:MAG: hypothetical protein SGI86_01855 [Deltaproteobacteria bacterium]|nr:hypothetical protein [Deltaproteobacteria bacterium]
MREWLLELDAEVRKQIGEDIQYVQWETLVRASAAVGMNFEPRLVAARKGSVSAKVTHQRKHAVRR